MAKENLTPEHILRMENFNSILDAYTQETGKSIQDWAHDHGFTRLYAYQIKGGHSPIGNSVARRIETAAGLPRGWLDRDHTNEPSEKGLQIAKKFDTLPEDDKRMVSDFINMRLQMLKAIETEQ